MNKSLSIAVVLLLILTSPFVAASELQKCARSLEPRSIEQSLVEQSEIEFKKKGYLSREARGYAILVGTMVASAMATTYVTSTLPANMQFVSHFLAQISTLGVYVFGAPIWEPLSSAFRKMAFGVKGVDSQEMPREATDAFESLWRRTQENYSLNAQMSRNLMTQFLLSVQQNFFEAYRAMNSDRPEYAADQIALAAFRLRTIFREISPSDPSVVAAIRASFVNHVHVDARFVERVAEHIARLDKDYHDQAVTAYYRELYRLWLQ